MITDFRPAIRKALNVVCTHDFLQCRGGSNSPAVTGSRIAWARLNKLRQMARSGELPNCTKLAQQFSTCTKTITRDLEFLRGEGLQIDYCGFTFRYIVHPKQEAS